MSSQLPDRRLVGCEAGHLPGGSSERVILFYKSEIVDRISVLEPVHIALVDLWTRYASVLGWSCANSYDAWIAPTVATAFGSARLSSLSAERCKRKGGLLFAPRHNCQGANFMIPARFAHCPSSELLRWTGQFFADGIFETDEHVQARSVWESNSVPLSTPPEDQAPGDDVALVTAVLQRDRKATAVFVDTYTDAVYSFIRRRLGELKQFPRRIPSARLAAGHRTP